LLIPGADFGAIAVRPGGYDQSGHVSFKNVETLDDLFRRETIVW
jgi:hypothetical protein